MLRPVFSARGYTLIEVLIAAVLVAIGAAAAAMLSLTMVSQQLTSVTVARALNYQEQACRLYQLGLDQTTITNILPRESGVTSLTFSTSSVTLTNVGIVHLAVCTNTYNVGSLLTSSGTAAATQTNVVAVVRPSIR